MNLYLLTQHEVSGWDVYDSCIVAAPSISRAKMISPSIGIVGIETSDMWANDIKNVKAKLIGSAKNGTKEGVILASFNAG